MGTISALETIETPSINDGPIAGFRNAIINGNFNINQRGYVSGAATTVGQYTLDRWAVTNTTGLIFTTSQNKTTVTIPAGQTIKQVIEGVNLQTGKYVLSWKGTAQGRVNGGSYGASGLVVVDVVGGVNTTIEFNSGTVTDVQFEPGRIAMVTEIRPKAEEVRLCCGYYERLTGPIYTPVSTGGVMFSTTISRVFLKPSVEMRVPPIVSGANLEISNAASSTAAGIADNVASTKMCSVGITHTAFGATGQSVFLRLGASNGYVAFDAEIPI